MASFTRFSGDIKRPADMSKAIKRINSRIVDIAKRFGVDSDAYAKAIEGFQDLEAKGLAKEAVRHTGRGSVKVLQLVNTNKQFIGTIQLLDTRIKTVGEWKQTFLEYAGKTGTTEERIAEGMEVYSAKGDLKELEAEFYTLITKIETDPDISDEVKREFSKKLGHDAMNEAFNGEANADKNSKFYMKNEGGGYQFVRDAVNKMKDTLSDAHAGKEIDPWSLGSISSMYKKTK